MNNRPNNRENNNIYNLSNLTKNKLNQINFDNLLFLVISSLIKNTPTNNNLNKIDKFKKNVYLIFKRLTKFMKINNELKKTNSNKNLNTENMVIQIIFDVDKTKSNKTPKIIFEINWGPEKRFNEYVNILINELGLGNFNDFRNKGGIIKLNKIFERILSNNSNVTVQSEYLLSIIQNIINKIKEKRNFNNSNIAMDISQLNNLLEEFKKNQLKINSSKINKIIELKETLKGKNKNNEDLKELNNYLEILINSFNLDKLDYFFAFIFNAFIGNIINPRESKSLLIEYDEYLKKQYIFMNFLLNRYDEIKNTSNKKLVIDFNQQENIRNNELEVSE